MITKNIYYFLLSIDKIIKKDGWFFQGEEIFIIIDVIV